VAAAADMSAALPQLVEAYTKKTGQAVKLSFGASGNLTNQIRNGAPFDSSSRPMNNIPNS
jgi:molybdate transport system substrate-binding protein